jgi:hypothetical protein
MSRLLRDENHRVGRFKYLKPDRPAIEAYSLGIEWIAYALGTSLGVPVAPIYLEQYSGISGALSPMIPDSMNWKTFYEQQWEAVPIANQDILPLCVVFDIWIANCDRWAPNLLVQSHEPGVPLRAASGLKVWLIDHGVSYLWPPVKFALSEDGADLDHAVIGDGSTAAEQFIRKRISSSKVTRGYWATLTNLASQERKKLYRQVQLIEDVAIETAVRQVPGAYMSQSLLELTVQLIKARRDRVDELAESLICSI